jgi:hypothetical protein
VQKVPFLRHPWCLKDSKTIQNIKHATNAFISNIELGRNCLAPYFQILAAFWHILQLLNIPEYLTRAGSNKLDVWVKYLQKYL